jgi:hypothetical protein
MNLLNLTESDLDRNIYRIMRPDHVYSLFKAEQNVLVSPRLWDDPFENFILNAPAVLPEGETIEWGFRNDFYGQCWTLHQASDAMWRIYSSDQNGIRVRTTIRNAISGLAEWAGDRAHYQAYIGKVRYLSSRKLRSFGNSALRMPLNAADFASTLLVKRPAFKHESEIRLLFFADPVNAVDDGLVRYGVNPHRMIDQMMVDPRLTSKQAAELVSRVRQETQFRGQILRSLLYATPEGFTFRVNPA